MQLSLVYYYYNIIIIIIIITHRGKCRFLRVICANSTFNVQLTQDNWIFVQSR